MSQDITTKSSTGLDANIAALLCYVAGWISGLVFFFIEKDSRFVRFHAMQSILVSGALSIASGVIGSIPFIRFFAFFIGLLHFIFWIVMMYKAYNWETFKLPVAGDIAEQQAAKL